MNSRDILVFQPQIARVLETIGVLDEIEKYGCKIPSYDLLSEKGASTSKLQFVDLVKQERYLPISIIRSKFTSILKKEVHKRKIPILYGCRFSSIIDSKNESKDVIVNFKDLRNPLRFDVIVETVYRIGNPIMKRFDYKEIQRKPGFRDVSYFNLVLESSPEYHPKGLIEISTPRVNFLSFPVSPNRIFVSAAVPQDQPTHLFKSGSRDIKFLTEALSTHGEVFPIYDILLAIQKKKVQHCEARFPIPRCVENYVNRRSVVIGDAAHQIFPYYGQEDNLGLEEAFFLAQQLGKPDLSIDQALFEFDHARSSRIDKFLKLSQKSLETSQEAPSSGIKKMLRDNIWVPLRSKTDVRKKFEEMFQFN